MKAIDDKYTIPQFCSSFPCLVEVFVICFAQTVTVSVKTLFSFQAATDKTTEDVHQTILETNQLTQWWENIVRQMKQQDTDSQTCAVVKKC